MGNIFFLPNGIDSARKEIRIEKKNVKQYFLNIDLKALVEICKGNKVT